MAASVRGGIDIFQPERGGDKPGVESRHMPANHAGDRLRDLLDKQARGLDAVTPGDGGFREAGRADRRRGDDQRGWIKLVECGEFEAAIVERGPSLRAVALDR